jgi:erythromycin esterase-like protein
MPDNTLSQSIAFRAQRVLDGPRDFDPLLERIGDARFVLIGEASHGTHEFYRTRAQITQRLITEKGFAAVAAEADWPDAYRVNRFVQCSGEDEAAEALQDFRRFPAWMWRNADVLDFLWWLREHNDAMADERKVGFYGLDLYSLHASMQAVLRYLEKADPAAAARARYRYSCFEDAGEDPQAYGYAAGFGMSKTCENEVVEQLVDMTRRAAELAARDGRGAADEFFFAYRNAAVVKNAERYYRTMFSGQVSSWNVRDTHMVETLDALVHHLGPDAKIVVWAHNSHLGDARATEMGRRGELNVGQLMREKHGDDAVLVGFTTYTGTVTAATDWDGPAERKRVRPSLPGSYELLFHEAAVPDFLLLLRGEIANALRPERLERAIGVIYRPESERLSHYFHASLPEQFDAIIHYDRTRAVEPLERTSLWVPEAEAETYPWAV